MKKPFLLRTGRSCIFRNHIHLVFVTKYRRDVFTQTMLKRLKEIFFETCEQMEAKLLEFGGEDDHVHLMINIPPKLAIANLVGKLKGKSSYFLRREFWSRIKTRLWGTHLWSPSYCVVSCGGAPLEIIKQYIADQRKPCDNRQILQSKRFAGKKRDENKKWLA